MRVFVFAVLLSAFFVSYGQFEDKNWIVGAYVGSQIDISKLVFYPNVAYAINSNTLLGVIASATDRSNFNESIDENYGYESDNSSASLSLYIKKYKSLNEKFHLNLRLSSGFSWNYNRYVQRTLDPEELISRQVGRETGFNVGLTPGLTYKPLDWLLIEGNLGNLSFSRTKGKNDQQSTNKSSQFNSSIAFGSLGVKFIL